MKGINRQELVIDFTMASRIYSRLFFFFLSGVNKKNPSLKWSLITTEDFIYIERVLGDTLIRYVCSKISTTRPTIAKT